MKFTKVRAGWWATPDGTAAVFKDVIGWVSQADTNGSGVLCGCADDGWAAVVDPQGQLRVDASAGDVLDWFDTKRDAVAFLSNRK